MLVIAGFSIVEALVVVAILVICLVPGAITALKGHVALFVAGFFVGLVWLVAPFRLAKPNSPWARRFYSGEKLEKARSRYPKVDPADPDRSKLALTIGYGLIAAAFVAGIVAGVSGS
jgi:hypothetical protein